MSFAKSPAPSAGSRLVRAALRKRLHQDHHLELLRGSLQIGAPLPVYRLGTAGIRKANPLTGARKSGWCYPLQAGQSKGVAFVAHCRRGPVFAGINGGAFAERLFNAADLAVRELAANAVRFEPRLVEIPVLRIYALWLFARGGQSRFVSLSHLADRPLRIERDINPRIRAAVRRSGASARLMRRE